MADSGGDQPTVSVKLKVGTSAQTLANEMSKTMQVGASSAAASASQSADGMSKAFIPAKGIFGAIGNEFHKLQTAFGSIKLTGGLDTLPKSKDDAKEASAEYSKFAAAVDRSAVSSKSAGASFLSLGNLTKGAGSAGIFAMSALGVGAGVALAAVVGGAYAANARMESLKGTTLEMMALSPNKNMALKDAHDIADAYDMSYRRIAMGSGQTRDAVEAAFKSVAAGLDPFRQGGGTMTTSRKSGKQVEATVADMSQASRIVPGGLDNLTKEYEEMKSGKFASTGAIVAMATATKTLKGNAAEVAMQMARMTDVRRMQVAEEAMHRMAKQAKDMPMSFSEVSNSFQELVGLAGASFGEPFVRQLMPLLTDVRNWFVTNASQIEITARQVGQYIAGFVQGVAHIVGAFYSVFSSGSSKLGHYIREAFDYAKGAFQWIADNAVPIAQTFSDIFNVIITAIERVVGSAQYIVKTIGSEMGYWTAAKSTGNGTTDFLARLHKAVADAPFQARAKKAAAAAEAEGGDWIANGRGAPRQSLVDHSGDLVAMYNQASQMHNEGQRMYIANMLKGNEHLQGAFIKMGGDVKGGLVQLATEIGDTKFLDKIREAQKGLLDHGKPLAPVMQFNGNTFNIKQDFRDQDPDRVMLMFKQDIVSGARNRVQSRNAVGLGL